MRVLIVGLGIQGRKRLAIAGADAVATVDPVQAGARYRSLCEVPLSSFDAALVCTPDEPKIGLLEHLLESGKHVLVEKPLLARDPEDLARLAALAEAHRVVCYTAYNHRFEPHFLRMKQLLDSGILGTVYLCRLFYGNGTAREVRNSEWRDAGAGVLPDLGSHLLDTAVYWFGAEGVASARPAIWSADRFENRAFDHVSFAIRGRPVLEMEVTLLSWRNHFTCDVFGEHGSAHIESLCKWGPSTFTRRTRVLPSGRPPEEALTLVQPDPTWALEYAHFKQLCAAGEGGTLSTDRLINGWLADLADQALAAGGAQSA
ncbi:MAG: Gfo/Idh/MocA family oxidoreductase [Alphaproteobacteria bacterium]|nr:Gfo/Idh/MocA family oxidoreductase [Alphaproteobacteria bacterium]